MRPFLLNLLTSRRPTDAEEIAAHLTKGRTLREKGAWRRAERHFQRALRYAIQADDAASTAVALHMIAGLRLLNRKVDDAARLAADASAIYERIGDNARAAQTDRLRQTAISMGATA